MWGHEKNKFFRHSPNLKWCSLRKAGPTEHRTLQSWYHENLRQCQPWIHKPLGRWIGAVPMEMIRIFGGQAHNCHKPWCLKIQGWLPQKESCLLKGVIFCHIFMAKFPIPSGPQPTEPCRWVVVLSPLLLWSVTLRVIGPESRESSCRCIFKMYINLYTKYIYICVYIIDYTGIVATHVLFLLRYNICHGQKNSHLPSCCALSSHTFAGLTGPTISTSSGPGRNCATGGHLLGIMGMVWDDASTLHM